jgi:two-component system LytT family response regulator
MTGSARLRVFVTDDEVPARKKILRFLADEPEVSVVGEAGNGLDAVRQIRETRPDLLFLDVQMPEMDGFEVIRALAADVPPRVVFVTAHDEYAIQAFEVHAFGYLLKPFDQPRFRKVMADVRDRARADGDGKSIARMQELLRQFQLQAAPQPKLLVEDNGSRHSA